MTEWDQYIIEMFNVSYIEQDQFYAYDNEILKDVLEEERIVVYKQPNKTSYKRYREALLMLDMLYLEISTYFFASKEICVALLYILTKKYFEDTNYSLFLTHKQLAMHFYTEDANASDRLIQGSLILYELFSDFVAKTVEIHNLENLMVHFQLVSLYLGCMPSLNFRSQDLRKQTTNRDHIHLTYEEFLSAQTYNPEAWQTVNEIIKIKS